MRSTDRSPREPRPFEDTALERGPRVSSRNRSNDFGRSHASTRDPIDILQFIGHQRVEFQRRSVARAFFIEKFNLQFGFASGVQMEQIHGVAQDLFPVDRRGSIDLQASEADLLQRGASSGILVRRTQTSVLSLTDGANHFLASFLEPDDRARRAETGRAKVQLSAFERIEEAIGMRQPRRPRRETGRGDDDRIFHLLQKFVVQFLRLKVTVEIDRFSQRCTLKVVAREGIQSSEQLENISDFQEIVAVVRQDGELRRRRWSRLVGFLRVDDTRITASSETRPRHPFTHV